MGIQIKEKKQKVMNKPANSALPYSVVKEQKTYNSLRKNQLNAVSQNAPLI
jgi:hypothetical protein